MELMRATGLGVDERLQGIDLNLNAGEVLGIIGPNGSGKSTLLNCLAGIQPHRGQLNIAGKPERHMSANQRARQVALLPQSSQSAWALNVENIVTLGRLPWGDEDADKIHHAMHQAGVWQWRERRIDQLSGGEQSRVWLARVLAGEPRVLIADEPVASLDLYYQRHILELLRQYAGEGRAVLVSIHDLSLAARYCDRLCLMHQGRLYRTGTPQQVLTPEHLAEVFNIEVHVDFSVWPPIIQPR
ncbi:ABC transporter ATP-binding protein [Pseudomonas saudiphocaensis]|uniref:ABC transporter component n=1 Tax=Pseudomonas saudiphocaensis TaxID=1499686 RepID=A0A078LPR2_9PSED|nr:ABC transporter ATP-binding protein [Pseudomonas saudiphocaensis]CDZ94473.1 ABC transporter component [Pseudomonas saudiphocaensis]